MPSQIGVPALGIAPVADEKSHADPTDSIGRSALMTQLTKPAEEMLQVSSTKFDEKYQNNRNACEHFNPVCTNVLIETVVGMLCFFRALVE